MKRSLVASLVASLALALALLAAAVPAVLAADPGATEGPPPVDPAPTATPVATDGRTPPDGEISVDPTFITAAPTPSPSGEVRDATGRPAITPPPTDSIEAKAVSGTSLQVLLLLAVAGFSLALLAARAPAPRRR